MQDSCCSGKMKLQILVAVFLVVSVYGRPRNDVVKIPRWNMGSITCDVCEVVVRDIRAAILGREEEVIQSIVDRCEAHFLFRLLDCSAVASLLTPLLDKLTLTPETICRGLHFCTDSEHMAPELIVSGQDGVEGVSVMSQGSTPEGHTKVSYHQKLEQDFQCQLCESIVTIFYDTVTHQATWKDIARLINPLCKYYPHKDRCHGYIDRLPDEAFSFAVEFLNKEVDCKFLGFCSADKKSTLRTTGTHSSNVQCEVCEGIVMVLHDAVACPDTWTDLATMLLPKCAACPVPEQCKAFLNGLPAMMKTVADKYLNKETDCSQYCTNPPPEQVFLGTSTTTQCDLCQGVVTVLHDGIACSNTWTDIATMLLPKCADCPVPEQCKAFLNGLPTMMKTVADTYLNSKTDCAKFCTNPPKQVFLTTISSGTVQCDLCQGIVTVLHDVIACSDTWTNIANMLLPKCADCPVPEQCKAFLNGLPAMMKTLADKYLVTETDCARYCTNPPPEQVFLGTAPSNKCDLCQGLVTVLHDTMACSDVWTDISNMLLPKCADCPVPEQCKAFLNGLPAMMKTVADTYLNKDTDCAKYCTHPPEQVFLHLLSNKDASSCEVCKNAVSLVYTIFTSTVTWEEISHLLMPTCKHCPVPEKCRAFLKTLPATMQTVADGYLNADTDCTMFHFCTADNSTVFIDVQTKPDRQRCELCKSLITGFSSILTSTSKWNDIASMLNRTCKYWLFPDQCTALVNDLPDMLQTFADRHLNQIEDCKFLGFCPTASERLFFYKNNSEVQKTPSQPDEVQCTICRVVASTGHHMITENEQVITDKLTEYLTKWCETLASQAMRTQCAEDIAVVLPPIMVNFIKDTLNVNTLCVDLLHVCSSAN